MCVSVCNCVGMCTCVSVCVCRDSTKSYWEWGEGGDGGEGIGKNCLSHYLQHTDLIQHQIFKLRTLKKALPIDIK